jgi:hypothetical protein
MLVKQEAERAHHGKKVYGPAGEHLGGPAAEL